MKNEHEFLKSYQQILEEEKLDCTLLKENEQAPYERLLVFMGLDDKERERFLEVTCLKQAILPDVLDKNNNQPEFYRVQYALPLPFDIKEQAISQVTSFVCYLNKMIELHGFEVDEVNLKVSYRYVFVYGEKDFNRQLFISLVGVIMLIVEMYSETIDKIASQEKTFNQVLEEIVELGQKLTQ